MGRDRQARFYWQPTSCDADREGPRAHTCVQQAGSCCCVSVVLGPQAGPIQGRNHTAGVSGWGLCLAKCKVAFTMEGRVTDTHMQQLHL
jgi:hypothetical protein